MRPEFCRVGFPVPAGSRLVVPVGGDLFLLGLERFFCLRRDCEVSYYSVKFDLIVWKGGSAPSLKLWSVGDLKRILGMASLVFTIPKAFSFEGATLGFIKFEGATLHSINMDTYASNRRNAKLNRIFYLYLLRHSAWRLVSALVLAKAEAVARKRFARLGEGRSRAGAGRYRSGYS